MNGNPATTRDWAETKIGRLLVLSREGFHVTKAGRTTTDRVWKAKCDCGRFTTIKTSQITGTGGTKNSCGCLMGKYDRGVTPAQKRLSQRWKETRQNARTRKLSFELDRKSAMGMFQLPCRYCSQPSTETNPNGIDRTDSGQGYTTKNCVPCCRFCNQAKSNRTLLEFMDWIDKVHRHLHRFE